MGKIIPVLFLALLLSFSSAALAGSLRYTKPDFVIGVTEEIFVRCSRMIRDGDHEAFITMVKRGICGITKAGSEVYVEGATWTGKVEIRPKGSTGTLWTNSEAVAE